MGTANYLLGNSAGKALGSSTGQAYGYSTGGCGCCGCNTPTLTLTGIPTGTVTSGGYSWTNETGQTASTFGFGGFPPFPVWQQTVNGVCTYHATATGQVMYSQDGSNYFCVLVGAPVWTGIGGSVIYIGGLYANQTLATFYANPSRLTPGLYPNQIDQIASAGYVYQSAGSGNKAYIIPLPGTINGYIQQTVNIPSFPASVNVPPTSASSTDTYSCTPGGSFATNAMNVSLSQVGSNTTGSQLGCYVTGGGSYGSGNSASSVAIKGYPQSPDGIKTVGESMLWQMTLSGAGLEYVNLWSASLPGTFVPYLPNWSPTSITVTAG